MATACPVFWFYKRHQIVYPHDQSLYVVSCLETGMNGFQITYYYPHDQSLYVVSCLETGMNGFHDLSRLDAISDSDRIDSLGLQRLGQRIV